VRQTSQLLRTGVDALIGLAEAGLHGSAQERLLASLAKTYQIASLTPLAQLFLRTIASRESDISSAALGRRPRAVYAAGFHQPPSGLVNGVNRAVTFFWKSLAISTLNVGMVRLVRLVRSEGGRIWCVAAISIGLFRVAKAWTALRGEQRFHAGSSAAVDRVLDTVAADHVSIAPPSPTMN
jgi:hypothetical protein